MTSTTHLAVLDDEADITQLLASYLVPQGLRVLLVEDDPEVRSVVASLLEAMACEVIACADGEDALDMLAADQAVGLLSEAREPWVRPPAA